MENCRNNNLLSWPKDTPIPIGIITFVTDLNTLNAAAVSRHGISLVREIKSAADKHNTKFDITYIAKISFLRLECVGYEQISKMFNETAQDIYRNGVCTPKKIRDAFYKFASKALKEGVNKSLKRKEFYMKRIIEQFAIKEAVETICAITGYSIGDLFSQAPTIFRKDFGKIVLAFLMRLKRIPYSSISKEIGLDPANTAISINYYFSERARNFLPEIRRQNITRKSIQRVKESIAREKLRENIVSSHHNGFTYAEIARKMNVSRNVVAGVIYRNKSKK